MTKTYASYWSHLHVIEKSVSEIVSFLYLRATYVKAEKNVYIETVIFILHYVPYQIRRCRCNFFAWHAAMLVELLKLKILVE